MYTRPRNDTSSIMGAYQANPPRPVNLEEWDDGVFGNISYQQSRPSSFHQPWPYRFQRGDRVWVRSTDYYWHLGTVSSSQPVAGRTMTGDGLFWRIDYDRNKRRWVAPLDGEVKPDTEHTRQLLKAEAREWVKCPI
ncbi:hypothetical protein DFH29DRAFT_897766 [Suillus ampliporus]|nr:hypothetical protein DFH29DRAFT_897766 [Suillus ampliporus]